MLEYNLTQPESLKILFNNEGKFCTVQPLEEVRAAMMTREASFGERWHGDWESWDEPGDQMIALTALLWGPTYRRQEQMEPPFGRR